MVCAETPQSPIQVDKVNLHHILILIFTWFPSMTPAGMASRNKRFPSRNYSVILEITNGKNITEDTHTSKQREKEREGEKE